METIINQQILRQKRIVRNTNLHELGLLALSGKEQAELITRAAAGAPSGV